MLWVDSKGARMAGLSVAYGRRMFRILGVASLCEYYLSMYTCLQKPHTLRAVEHHCYEILSILLGGSKQLAPFGAVIPSPSLPNP